MSEKSENTINEDSDDRDENNCDDDCDDDDDDCESKNDAELTLEQKIQRAKITIGGGALVILGIFLAPVPILPLGIPTIGVGLHVLGIVNTKRRDTLSRNYSTVLRGVL